MVSFGRTGLKEFSGLGFIDVREPFYKEWPQVPLKAQVSKTIKRVTTSLLDVLVDTLFHFEAQPMLVQGNFAPVEEIGEAVKISCIEGEIPMGFPEGVYIRNGGNFLFGQNTATVSIFGRSSFVWVEGEGMLHAMYFNKDYKGTWCISYKNKYVESDSFKIEKARNRPTFLPATLGYSPAVLMGALLNQASQIFLLMRFGMINKDLTNTSVFEHGGRVFAIAENHLPYEIELSDLNTLNTWDINGAWDRPFTSHPKRDPLTGEMVIMGVDAKKPYYVIGVISADGKNLVHKADLKFERNSFPHELGITKNFNVIMDYPFTFDRRRLINGGPFLKFEHDQPARIGVMPRYGDAASIAWFDVQTHCSFHIINSFEDGDEVVIRGCRANGAVFPGPDLGINIHEWYSRAFSPIRKDAEGFDPSIDSILLTRAYEWRLNMKNVSMDFPVINDNFVCLAKYNMFAKLHFEELGASHLQKGGKKRIKVEYHRLEKNEFCDGVVFVARPGSTEEDDGWILCFIHNENTNTSHVHMIDAKKFEGAPVAKIKIPHRVPYGFHGSFLKEPRASSQMPCLL
ncbi:hypothetical protein AMTRI_Chr05g67090 [Amborella trichopoda]